MTSECESRQRRIDGLKSKADSTEFEGERTVLLEKIAQLEDKQRAEGYIAAASSTPSHSVFNEIFKAQHREETLKRYRDIIRRNEEAKSHELGCYCEDCLRLDPYRRYRISDPHCDSCKCRNCTFLNNLWKNAKKDPSPRVKKNTSTTPRCSKCFQAEESCDECLEWYRILNDNRTDTSTRISHKDCYAQGLHDKTPAGRSSCRKAQRGY